MSDCKYMTPTAVIVLIIKNDGDNAEVLCQRRCNTGFGDGMFDFSCSGKVEEGETMTEAAVRELKEELDITVRPDWLDFMSLVHKRDEQFDVTYVNVYFICKKYEGTIRIAEKDKCSELKWFKQNNLPADLLDDRRVALFEYKNGNSFFEYGWHLKN